MLQNAVLSSSLTNPHIFTSPPHTSSNIPSQHKKSSPSFISSSPKSHPHYPPNPPNSPNSPNSANLPIPITMNSRRGPRKPGRPPVYIFDKPEDQLTPDERKKMTAIIKRRIRQNKAYRRRRAIRNNNRTNHPPNAQVVPEPNFAPSQPVQQHSLSQLNTNPTNNPWPQDTPRMISDFSQNPLELLASASGTGPNSSASLSNRSSMFPSTNPLVDTSPSPKPQPTSSLSQHTHFSVPSVIDQPSSHPVSATSEQTVLEIDATVSQIDLPSLPFSVDKPKEDDDVTTADDLVSSALIAAQEYSKSTVNMKDAMDSESELLRMTGIKSIVFDNLRAKYGNMGATIQNALRHFVIFPRTFNLHAAASVAGLQESQLVDMQGMLESMIQSNFINEVNGRYVLNEAARLFLNEDETVLKDSFGSNAYFVAQRRFVKHYQSQLSKLQNEQIHKVGWFREQAMAWYDSERDNVVYSEFLLDGKGDELREFLSAGITVMRYCESAGERERVLHKALTDDETSTEEIMFPPHPDNPAEETSSAQTDEKRIDCDKSHRARLQLALSEAYFDQLKTDEAERPLLNALQLMVKRSPRCERSRQSGIVDLVLALLLLSNLRLGANKTTEARKLCIRALSTLKDATLGRSTFGINAMSNLVTIYLREGQLDKAKSVASKLLDILNTMRYTGMPIYADALGVCAMVSMAEGSYVDAERQYLTALETVGKWGSKDWAGVPVEHCLDLDLWLMEGLADAIRSQGRADEARTVEQKAAADRESRGLSRSTNFFDDFLELDPMDDAGKQGKGIETRQTLRHLY